jgi:hypothetical protein
MGHFVEGLHRSQDTLFPESLDVWMKGNDPEMQMVCTLRCALP